MYIINKYIKRFKNEFYNIYIYINICFNLNGVKNIPPVVPGPRGGGSFEKRKTIIGRRWPIGKLLRCRSKKVLKLWGPMNQ